MGILLNIAIILKMSETYGFLTVTELKSELRKRNAKVPGKKEALIERYMAVLKSIRRNLLSVLFPTVTVIAIWADWSRTRSWKKNQIKN